MSKLATAIPPDERVDDLIPLSDGSAASDEPRDGPAVGLEMERFGLLAGPAAPVDRERMIEAWIASNLDFDIPAESAPPNIWDRIVGRLPTWKRPPKPRRQARGR